jgi:hypothetical protein
MRSRIIVNLLVAGGLATGLAGVAVSASTILVTHGTLTTLSMTVPYYPVTGPAFVSCEPSQEPELSTIQIAGIPSGSSVSVLFMWSQPFGGTPNYQPTVTYNSVTSGSLTVPVNYPDDSSLWPVIDPSTNERAIAVAVNVLVSYQGTTYRLSAKKWWVRCPAEPRPNQGCALGYWKNHPDSWPPTGYAATDSFGAAFNVTPGFNPSTLDDAVNLGGGGERALARHAVAALLNATSGPTINYTYTEEQVKAMVADAYQTGNFEPTKDLFDFANNAGCPLN